MPKALRPSERASIDRTAVFLEVALVVFGAGLLAGTVAAVIGYVAGMTVGTRRQRHKDRPGLISAERHRNVRAAAAR